MIAEMTHPQTVGARTRAERHASHLFTGSPASAANDEDFAALFPVVGQPAETTWRLALVLVMQFAENLTDRQAAAPMKLKVIQFGHCEFTPAPSIAVLKSLSACGEGFRVR